jgi:hypothetical protein
MHVTPWPQVCLSLIGVYLAFIIPAAILIAVVKMKKIKLTPLLIYGGVGIVVLVAALILIPMGPIGRQLPWLTIMAWALGSGLLAFLATALSDGLSRVLGRPNIRTFIERWNSLQVRRPNESRHREDSDQTKMKPAEDNRPDE